MIFAMFHADIYHGEFMTTCSMRRIVPLAVLLGVAAMVSHGGCGANADQQAYDQMATLRTVEDFEAKVVQADRPVLVDFYATWCGPCKRLAPTIGSLAREYGDRVDFYRVDVEKADKLAKAMKIQGIPAVFIYANGSKQSGIVGADRRETYAKALDKAIEKMSQ